MKATVNINGTKYEFELSIEHELAQILSANSKTQNEQREPDKPRVARVAQTLDQGQTDMPGGIPTSKQIERYIENLPDGMTHNLGDVSQHFLSVTLHAKGDAMQESQYSRLYLRHRTAIHRLERRLGKKFYHVPTPNTTPSGKGITVVTFSLSQRPMRTSTQQLVESPEVMESQPREEVLIQ